MAGQWGAVLQDPAVGPADAHVANLRLRPRGLQRLLHRQEADAVLPLEGTVRQAPERCPFFKSRHRPCPEALAAKIQTVPHWEYSWAVAQPGGRNVGDLEKLGKEGWEVVGPVNAYTGDRWNFLLKRQLAD
ncbi:hypothetical protein [Kitasatospora sp. NPDC001175]|uniref:hypothetical protein n=1 Tax=Kitasatospora sp. NPDC001175 TaxID=3157103 RepID=UPI003CFD0D7D